MAEPTDFGWSRLVRHSVTVDVELRMAGRPGDAHPRPIQSGYRAQWDGLRNPDALLFRDIREAPLILANRTAVAAGEVAAACLYPMALREWDATTVGDRLVLVTAGSLKRLGEATVVAIHGLSPGDSTASTGSVPEGKTE